MRLSARTIVISAIAGALAIGFVLFSGSWTATAKHELQMFSSEHDAAYAGSNIKTEPAIATVKQGASLVVLWDTYGKDYWACYVQTPDNIRGWVLCTSLQRVA